jgi:hypothetical protein
MQNNQDPGLSREYLAFTLGDEEYGIDILMVQEIRSYETVTKITNTPDFIKGVINLRSVIGSNFEAVSQLFASGNGLAKRFDDVLKNYLSSDGALSSRADGVNKQIGGISDQRGKLNLRLSALDARYRKQFTAMDALVGQLQATGSYLTQQLANLPGFTNNSSN